MQALGGDFPSQAYAVSADGKVVVGDGADSTGLFAVAWKDDGTILNLGTLGSGYGVAYGVSGDGSVIVGTSWPPGALAPFTAFIWDETHGMRSVQDVLTQEYGLDLTGWYLSNANWVSDDGRIILGGGTDPLGNHQAWMAILPEPGLLSLVFCAGVLLVRVRRKR